VIGRDASSDLAVVKIDGYGSALHDLWQLRQRETGAVGAGGGLSPLTLETTVTAGIVSAKGRTIGINSRQSDSSPVEAFIQTDAAINQGNSGGALITTGRTAGRYQLSHPRPQWHLCRLWLRHSR
jgi:S1-C subfamily serine protease